MSDKVRAGRGMDDRDVVRKSNPLQCAALLGCELPPRVLRVRLFLDAGISLSADERSEVRHALYG